MMVLNSSKSQSQTMKANEVIISINNVGINKLVQTNTMFFFIQNTRMNKHSHFVIKGAIKIILYQK